MEFKFITGSYVMFFLTPCISITISSSEYPYNSIGIVWLRYHLTLRWK